MCEKINSSAQLQALTKAKQLETALRTNFGEEKLQIAKLLLANPVFRVFIRMAGSLTFEAYAKRFFSICVSLSSVVNFHYYTVDEPNSPTSFKFTDDILNTGAHTAWYKIKNRLSEMRLLKAMAMTLPIVSIYKVADRSFEEINLKFKRIFDRKKFEEKVLPLIEQHRPKTYAMKAEAGNDDMLYLDFVFRCFAALRELYDGGEVEKSGVEPNNSLPELTLAEAVVAIGKKGFRVPDTPEFSFISVMLQQYPCYSMLKQEGQIYIDKPFDPFTIIGGSYIDFSPLRKAKYVLRTSVAKQETLAVLDEQCKPVKIARPQAASTPESFVEDHFNFDINMPEYSKIIFANDPDIEIAVRGMSKTSHQWVKKWLPTPMEVSEALTSAVHLLKGKLKGLGEEQMKWAAAGRVLAMKGNLILDAGVLSRK